MPPSRLPGFCSLSTEVVCSQSGFDSTLPEGSASSRPVPDFYFHTEVILFLSDGGQSVFVERPEVCSPIRFSADGGSVSSTSEEVLARFPSVVGPSPVLLPEGRFPSSVSARWFPSRSFSTKPFVATEVVPKNCYCYTSRQNTVIGNSTTEVVALPVPHSPKVV